METLIVLIMLLCPISMAAMMLWMGRSMRSRHDD
jgi:hypothetical protein